MVPFARAFDQGWQIETFGRAYEQVVKVTSSQSGKTDSTLDVIGQTLEQVPAPILYVGPSRDWFIASQFEQRLSNMLATSPGLKEKASTGKKSSRWRKLVGGVPIGLAWAGSPSQLRGMSARISILDELDAMGAAAQRDGDPFSLLEARGASFADRIRAAISTPLTGAVDVEVDPVSGLELWRPMEVEDVQSPIWRLFQAGTRHHFCWPCPHCDAFFVPRFKQLRWQGYPEAVAPAIAQRTAHIECPHCGGVIEDKHKRDLNARGVYVAPGQYVEPDGTVVGDPPDATTLSFWSSGLCSPFVTIGQRAASYCGAKIENDPKKLQSVINTGFGECYAPGGGDVPEWQEVAACRRPYRSVDVPAGVQRVTMTVDVQKNRLVYVIRGWGEAATSWRLLAGELYGETTQEKVWNDLGLLLKQPVGDFAICRCLVDSGFRPGKPINLPVNRVYEFCRKFRGLAYATKGKQTADKPLKMSRIEVTTQGSAKRYGLELLWLDTDWCKQWVHERIRWDGDQPGAWYLPEDASDGYCKQITSEARVRKPTGAAEWVRRSRENHFLDCEAMQAAAQHSLNLHLLPPIAVPEPEAPPPPVVSRRRVAPPTPAPAASSPPARQAPPPQQKPAPASAVPPATDQRAARRAKLKALTARLYGTG